MPVMATPLEITPAGVPRDRPPDTDQQVERATVRAVNDLRARASLGPVTRLRPGSRADPATNPVAVTLRLGAGLDAVVSATDHELSLFAGGRRMAVASPAPVGEFLRRHQHGRYPHLLEGH